MAIVIGMRKVRVVVRRNITFTSIMTSKGLISACKACATLVEILPRQTLMGRLGYPMSNEGKWRVMSESLRGKQNMLFVGISHEGLLVGNRTGERSVVNGVTRLSLVFLIVYTAQGIENRMIDVQIIAVSSNPLIRTRIYCCLARFLFWLVIPKGACLYTVFPVAVNVALHQ